MSSSADEEILPYTTGEIEEINLIDRVYNDSDFPILPPGQIPRNERIFRQNREALRDNPWSRGLLENIMAVDMILRSRLQNKNRYSLILLDSCLEISFKEYIVNVLHFQLSQRQSRFREDLISTIRNNIDFEESIWTRINYYYRLRNSLYHETATLDVIEEDIMNFRELVCNILSRLFNLSFEY